jgi:hypothetical protein
MRVEAAVGGRRDHERPALALDVGVFERPLVE